jgi:glucan phosphoethanolaminetransferase (alkaline phosphatase superfamily)
MFSIEFIKKVFFTLIIEEYDVFFPLIFFFCYFIFSLLIKKERNTLTQIIILLIPFFYIFYQYSYLSNFFSSIGQDSLVELNADFGEAIFYIKTFLKFLLDPEIFRRNRFWLVLICSMLSGILFYFFLFIFFKRKNIHLSKLNKFFNGIFTIVLIITVYFSYNFIANNIKLGSNLEAKSIQISKNIEKYHVDKKNSEDLMVILYVGESTSALNFSLYGYPFETTNYLKKLEKNLNFIKFDNVYSTHTHTSPSLINTFTICTDNINSDKCMLHANYSDNSILPVTDIISSKINTYLFSTQGELGGHNFGGKLVFELKKKFFSHEYEKDPILKFKGNRYVPKLKDKEFFENIFCNKNESFKNKEPSLSVLHSYAGHGKYNGYLDYIADDIRIKYPNYLNGINLLGKDSRNFKNYREYDSSIKYIDLSLENVITCSFRNSKKTSKPLIFIYFSDHGESPGSLRGHDSSRLTYEMLHVPFFIIFNDEARIIYESKFKKLKDLSKNDLTLKVVSDILLYLFEIDIIEKSTRKTVYKHQDFKSKNKNYILGRKDLDGKISKLPFNDNKIENIGNLISKELYGRLDTSINLWLLQKYLDDKKISNRTKIEKIICRHRANSLYLQFQSSLSNSCFETDIIIKKGKFISSHDSEKETKLDFEYFFNSDFKENILWLDIKNINTLDNCNQAYIWIKKNKSNFKHALLEIPTKSIRNINDDDWTKCIKEISKIENITIGYYLPTDTLTKCSTNKIFHTNCKNIIKEIEFFLLKNEIENVTFDVVGYNWLKNNKFLEKFKWNIWHIDDLDDLEKILNQKNIGILLLRNDKFTNYLN